MKSKALLFEILRSALWESGAGRLPEMTNKETAAVLKEAERQAITGLVFDCLSAKHLPLSRDLVYQYLLMSQQIRQQNMLMNKSLCQFTQILQENGIGYVVVKGQSVACHYPKPMLRQSGDVDFYCSKNDFETAKNLLPKLLGVTFRGLRSRHHYSFDFLGIEYEMHFSLTDFYNKKRDAYWQHLVDDTPSSTFELNGQKIATLEPTLHAFYIFQHLYEHLMELGVGLRQFCDWAMILHGCRAQIDHAKLRQNAETLGMDKAMRACGVILIDYLGLPEEDFPYRLTDKDRQYSKRILDVVFYRGNMGHYNKRNGFRGRKHQVEATGIKVSHFVKFFPLAPKFTWQWICTEIPRKIRKA